MRGRAGHPSGVHVPGHVLVLVAVPSFLPRDSRHGQVSGATRKSDRVQSGVCGESRRRRGGASWRVRGQVAAGARRGESVDGSRRRRRATRGYSAAAATWIFRGPDAMSTGETIRNFHDIAVTKGVCPANAITKGQENTCAEDVTYLPSRFNKCEQLNSPYGPDSSSCKPTTKAPQVPDQSFAGTPNSKPPTTLCPSMKNRGSMGFPALPPRRRSLASRRPPVSVVAAAAEYPRPRRGVAATRRRGISASPPRRRRRRGISPQVFYGSLGAARRVGDVPDGVRLQRERGLRPAELLFQRRAVSGPNRVLLLHGAACDLFRHR